MKNIVASLAFLVLVGCGSNGSVITTPPPPDASPDLAAAPDTAPDTTPDLFVDPLVGSWVDEVDTTTTYVFKFDGTNFEMDGLANLADGSIGMRIDQGTYTLSGSTINARLLSSSCQGVIAFPGHSATWTFTKTGNSISVNTGTKYMVFQLATKAPTGMGMATIGCFKDDGTFVAHSASPVP